MKLLLPGFWGFLGFSTTITKWFGLRENHQNVKGFSASFFLLFFFIFMQGHYVYQ